MSTLKAHRGRKTSTVVAIPPIDLDGFGLVHDFSFLKSSKSMVNYCALFIGWTGSTNQGGAFYVYFDDNNELSMNSKVGTISAPSSETLQQRYDSTGWNYMCTHIICNITSHAVAMPNNYIMEGGVLNTLKGKPAIKCRGLSGSSGNPVSALDYTNDHTVHAIGSSNMDAANAGFVSTVQNYTGVPFSRYEVVMQRSTTARITVLRSSAATTYQGNYITQQNHGDQRRLSASYESGVEMNVYFNTVHQETVALLATTEYVNTALIFATAPDSGNKLDGYFQAVRIRSDKSVALDVTALDSRLNDYYNF